MSTMLSKTKIEVDTGTIADGDSIASYLVDSAGALLTSTLLSGKQRLDVILPSEKAEDSAHTTGDYGTAVLAVRNDAGTSLVGSDGDYGNLQLDNSGRLRVIADFTSAFDFIYAEDSPHTSGESGAFILGVRNDSNATLTNTDLDYSPIATDLAGRVKTVSAGIYAEDATAASGAEGMLTLSVRRDTAGAQTSANGDYAEFQTNKIGELRVIDKVEISSLQQVVTVTTTATALPTTALANRKKLIVQNVGTRKVYLGSSTVTADATATGGMVLERSTAWGEDISADVTIYGIVSTGTCDVVVWEFS